MATTRCRPIPPATAVSATRSPTRSSSTTGSTSAIRFTSIRRRRLTTLVAALALAAPAAAQAAERDLTLSVSGDLLIHSPVFQQALENGGGESYDFRPFFRELDPWVEKADLALCHVEVPMSSAPPSGYPLFNSPPALAKGIAASGWDACDTASNHTLDQGKSGIGETIEALRRNDVGQTGSAASRKAARRILFLKARNLRVAVLAYTTDTNGIPPPEPWSVNQTRSPKPIVRDARRARRHGADLVVVNVHWGPSLAPEYSGEVSAAQRDFAERLTAANAIDAVVGQGPHVVQPIRWINGKPVVFSEGNLISNQSAACCVAAAQDGLVALVDFAVRDGKPRAVMVRYMPIFVSRPDYVVLPANRPSLRSSRRRTVATVGRDERVRPLR